MNSAWTLDTIRERTGRKAQFISHKLGGRLPREIAAPGIFEYAIGVPRFDLIKSQSSRTIGILLARPDHPIASSEIIPNLNYFHVRSGLHIDFYCAGYGEDLTNYPDSKAVTEHGPENQRWFFSDTAFVKFLEAMESESTWKYKGGVELLLLVASVDLASDKVEIDFSKVVCVDIVRAISDKAIVSINQFVEEVIRDSSKLLSLEEMSDRYSAITFIKAMCEFFLMKIPFGAGPAAKKTAYFLVHDKSR